MTREEKMEMIDNCDASEQEKERLRKLVAIGFQVQEDARLWIEQEYGFEGIELDKIVDIAHALAGSPLVESMEAALVEDESLSDEQRAKILSAIFDHAKFVAKRYFQSKTASGVGQLKEDARGK